MIFRSFVNNILRDYELGRKGENQKVKRSSKTIYFKRFLSSLIRNFSSSRVMKP